MRRLIEHCWSIRHCRKTIFAIGFWACSRACSMDRVGMIAGGPAAYFATLPVNAIANALGAAGLPAEISNSAGTYVCNQVFYRLMHHTADAGHRWHAGFMHVPHAFDAAARPQAKMPLDDIVRGIHIALEVSAVH